VHKQGALQKLHTALNDLLAESRLDVAASLGDEVAAALD
jgi:hypothetical protein